jgi:histidine triad (HIT) family protein
MAIEVPTGSACTVCEFVVSGNPVDRVELRRTTSTIAWLTDGRTESGQVVIAPLRHAPTILELTDDETAAVFVEARDLAIALSAAFDPDGITLHQHNGTIEQQQAPHFELFLGPKRFGSGWGERGPDFAQEPFRLTDEIVGNWMQNYDERLATAARIRDALEFDAHGTQEQR